MNKTLLLILAFIALMSDVSFGKKPTTLADLEGREFTAVIGKGSISGNYWSILAHQLRKTGYNKPQSMLWESTKNNPDSPILSRQAKRGESITVVVQNGKFVPKNHLAKPSEPIVPAKVNTKQASQTKVQPTTPAGLPQAAEALAKVGELIANNANQIPMEPQSMEETLRETKALVAKFKAEETAKSLPTKVQKGVDFPTPSAITEIGKFTKNPPSQQPQPNIDGQMDFDPEKLIFQDGSKVADFDPEKLIFQDGSKVADFALQPIFTVEITPEQLQELRQEAQQKAAEIAAAKKEQERLESERTAAEKARQDKLKEEEVARKAFWDELTPWLVGLGVIMICAFVLWVIRYFNLKTRREVEKESFNALRAASGAPAEKEQKNSPKLPWWAFVRRWKEKQSLYLEELKRQETSSDSTEVRKVGPSVTPTNPKYADNFDPKRAERNMLEQKIKRLKGQVASIEALYKEAQARVDEPLDKNLSAGQIAAITKQRADAVGNHQRKLKDKTGELKEAEAKLKELNLPEIKVLPEPVISRAVLETSAVA